MACNNASKDDRSKDSQVEANKELIKNQSGDENDVSPLQRGARFAMQTQSVLASNLINAINTQGTVYALAFCSEKVYPLTDSMALELDVKLKRVSDKPRNSKNRANGQEMAYISKSKDLLANGEEIKPEIAEINGKMVGYYPIITNQICMQCHGKQSTEVLPKTLSKIEELYPDDEGIGYGINELRGIWVVEMKK